MVTRKKNKLRRSKQKKSKQRRSKQKKSKQRRSKQKKSKQRRSKQKKSKQRRSKQKKSKRRRSKQKKIKGGVRFSGQTSICADNGGSNIRSQGLKVSPSELVNKPNSFIINDDKKIKSIDDNKLHKVCSRAEIRYGINSKDCKKICPDPDHYLAYNNDQIDSRKFCCYTEDKNTHPHVTDIIKNFTITPKIKKKKKTADTKKIHTLFNDMEDHGELSSYNTEDIERFKTNYTLNTYTLTDTNIKLFIHDTIKEIKEDRIQREDAKKKRDEAGEDEGEEDLGIFGVLGGDDAW